MRVFGINFELEGENNKRLSVTYYKRGVSLVEDLPLLYADQTFYRRPGSGHHLYSVPERLHQPGADHVTTILPQSRGVRFRVSIGILRTADVS